MKWVVTVRGDVGEDIGEDIGGECWWGMLAKMLAEISVKML